MHTYDNVTPFASALDLDEHADNQLDEIAAPEDALTWRSAAQRNRQIAAWRRAVLTRFGERPRALRVACSKACSTSSAAKPSHRTNTSPTRPAWGSAMCKRGCRRSTAKPSPASSNVPVLLLSTTDGGDLGLVLVGAALKEALEVARELGVIARVKP
jgi:hypothetical protein